MGCLARANSFKASTFWELREAISQRLPIHSIHDAIFAWQNRDSHNCWLIERLETSSAWHVPCRVNMSISIIYIYVVYCIYIYVYAVYAVYYIMYIYICCKLYIYIYTISLALWTKWRFFWKNQVSIFVTRIWRGSSWTLPKTGFWGTGGCHHYLFKPFWLTTTTVIDVLWSNRFELYNRLTICLFS